MAFNTKSKPCYMELLERSKETRHNQTISANPCPECGKKMKVGDEEASGICGECYWSAHEDYNN